jgi:hypothetical protein
VAVCLPVRVRRGAAATACCLAVAGCGASDEPATRTVVPSASLSQPRALGLTRELPDAYRRVCAEQAAYAPSGARVCPPLIPQGGVKVMYAGAFSKRREQRGGYLADLASSSLSDLGDERIETKHWHYDVSWSPAVRRVAVRDFVERPVNASEASACRNLRLGSERVEACRVVPYEEGGGLHGGHIAYVWTHGRASYVVSLHGYANEPRARAMTRALIAEVLGR